MIAAILISFIFALCVIPAILWFWKRQKYFRDHNIPFIKSIPILGAYSDLVFNKRGLYEVTEKIYNDPKLKDEPFYGMFMFHVPMLVIKDMDLLNRILISDFKNFTDRRLFSHEKDPLGTLNIFALKNPRWKELRAKLTPFFTNSKMKQMFYIFDKISSDMVCYINKQMGDKTTIEMEVKFLGEIYSTDIFASAALGIQANSLDNPDGEFATIANHIFSITTRRSFELLSNFMLPEVTKLLNVKMFTEKGSNFMLKTMTHVINEREKNGTKRNDLVDALVEIRKTDKTVTMEFLVAQAVSFLAAGYETSSGTMAFALYELAKNQDIQRRVRLEIKESMKENDGKLIYDEIVHKMPFLDQVISESLRLYPVLPFLDRECTNPDGYSLEPYSSFKIPNKMTVIVPMYPLLRDEKYFENPLKFDPDRFAPDKPALSFLKHLPFGNGPRSCLGERFGVLNVKAGIVKILKEFRIEPSRNTPNKIIPEKKAFVIKSSEPLLLNLIREDIFEMS